MIAADSAPDRAPVTPDPAADAAPALSDPIAAAAPDRVDPSAPLDGAEPARVAASPSGNGAEPDDSPHGTLPLPLAPEPVPEGMTAATAPTEIVPYDVAILRPLPEGAILDGRYAVRVVVQSGPTVNLYRAHARAGQRCAQCGALAAAEAIFCARCGQALTGQEPLPAYLITEASEPEALRRAATVVERGLNHPHLMALMDLFTYSPYGPPRHYAVAEARQGVPLERLALPQPAAMVLEWGVQLSDALRYLHSQGMLSPGFSPTNVLIKEDEAVLANLQEARPAPPEPPEHAHEMAEDVAGLAGTLYETLTGRYAGTAGAGALLPNDLPPEAEAAFSRALRPAAGSTPITAEEWHRLLTAARDALYAATANIRVRSGRISDVGRHRELNEDSLSAIECQVVQESVSAGIGVYAVADGMGGHAGGEVASALAIATVTEGLLQHFIMPQFSADSAEPTPEEITAWLTAAVQAANERIHSERGSRGNDMGTTLVVALITGQRAYIANVGDSRAYLLTPTPGGEAALKQITVDHSLVQRLVSMGQITPEEAKYHPYRNMIYKSLGERPQAEIDTFVERLTPGTRLLLCSDGLSGMVPDPALRAALAGENDPQVACGRMVAEANAAGGLDNITAVAVYIEAG